MPGNCYAAHQEPPVSSATNACPLPEESVYKPPAAQLPADAHDTDQIIAPVPGAAMPGTWVAVRHLPFTSLTTNGCCAPEAL
jgi:hypothetical protein